MCLIWCSYGSDERDTGWTTLYLAIRSTLTTCGPTLESATHVVRWSDSSKGFQYARRSSRDVAVGTCHPPPYASSSRPSSSKPIRLGMPRLRMWTTRFTADCSHHGHQSTENMEVLDTFAMAIIQAFSVHRFRTLPKCAFRTLDTQKYRIPMIAQFAD